VNPGNSCNTDLLDWLSKQGYYTLCIPIIGRLSMYEIFDENYAFGFISIELNVFPKCLQLSNRRAKD